MHNIVISGYYGFGNAGDEAMLAAILDSLADAVPDAKITVISGNPKRTVAIHKTEAVHRFHYGQIIKKIRACDIVISGGGSLLQDVTSLRSLYYYLSIIGLGVLWKKPVMLYGQGIGPIRNARARKWAGSLLNKVQYITVRDEDSLRELQAMGVKRPTIEVTADAVLSMHPAPLSMGKDILKRFNVHMDKPKIGISVRPWEKSSLFQTAFAEAADRLIELGCEVIFIPMQHRSDTSAGKEIAALMKHQAVVLDEEYSTVEAMSLLGTMDVVVGMRLHALIFSALMKVPMIGISYDPKVASFMAMIHEPVHSDIYSLTSQGLYEEVCQKLEQRALSTGVVEQIDRLRNRSAENARIAQRVMSNPQA